MQCAQRHQIYPAAEQSGEFVSKFLYLPAQPSSRAQCVQNIDVTARSSGPAGLRAEDLKLGDSIPVADFGHTSLVNVDAGDNHHGFRLALEGSQMPHLSQVPCDSMNSSP